MKAFQNKTDAGHELAIRRGKRVPDDAVGLSYVRSPQLNPRDNVVIVDASRIVEQNTISLAERRKLYYANGVGILEDENGNQLVGDEFPYVTDVFSIDEDFSVLPASEYKPEHILPFYHVSRYFHLDFAGLVLPGDQLFDFDENVLKVTDAQGRQYLNENGAPRYKIKITQAISDPNSIEDYEMAYRVYVYVDSDENNELYLTYNKVEVGTDGTRKNFKANYKELLNLRPIFEYLPEESEVVDRASYYRKVYSSKPTSMREQVLGLPLPTIDGYKVYVPKKAIPDPRIFQLFHWRVACDFTQSYAADVGRSAQSIKAGVLVTTASSASNAPYCLVNLARSAYNATNVTIQNPLQSSSSSANVAGDQTTAAYWQVNIDTVTFDELKQFDLLIWAPTAPAFDFAPYVQKVDYFTSNGGTLFIDTSGFTVPQNLKITTTNGLTPSNGAIRTAYGDAGTVQISSITVDATNSLFNGVSSLGGWAIPDTGVESNNDERQSLSWIQTVFPSSGYTQYITTYPSDWKPIVTIVDKPVTIYKSAGKGNIIFSTFSHLYTCSALFDYVAPGLVSDNRGTSLYQTASYQAYINSIHVEGAMKLLFNVVLLAVKGRSLDDADQTAYSSSWTFSSDWHSSWVIDGSVLSDAEQERYDFTKPTVKDAFAATPDMSLVKKRRLSGGTCKQLIDQAVLADPDLRTRQLGGTRAYHVEVTSPNVKVQSVFTGDSYVEAWTEAYSPAFVVPPYLGPNVIREEEIKGQYAAANYEHRVYPPKPYAGVASASYTDTYEVLEKKTLYWKAVGSATEVFKLSDAVPASVTTGTHLEVKLSWWKNPQSWSAGAGVTQDGPRWYIQTGNEFKPRFGYRHPVGITTWQEQNYYGSASGNAHLNWPYMGMTGRFLQGATGDVVKFVQDFLNRSIGAGLTADGNYSARVATAVENFQTRFGARFIDGVIDAETWSLIGYQIIANNFHAPTGVSDFRRFYDYPWTFLSLDKLSDDNAATVWAKRSWSANGRTIKAPPVIWDYVMITFDQQYDIHQVEITPYVEGAASTILLKSIHIGNFTNLVNYSGVGAQLPNLPYKPVRDQAFPVPIQARGQSLIVGIGQDSPAGAGWGEARMMGLRDIAAWTYIDTPPVFHPEIPMRTQTNDRTMEVTGLVTVSALQDAPVQVVPTPPDTTYTLLQGSYKWTKFDVYSDPAMTIRATNVSVSFDLKAGIGIIKSHLVDQLTVTGNFTSGPAFPGGVYYSMNAASKALNPIPEMGFVSKAEGVKVLCNADQTPYGLPPTPALIGANEAQRHFMTVRLENRGNDSSVTLGFYDIAQQEFITNAEGKSEMSYIEWVSRGIQNVYIGVVSTYQQSTTNTLPADTDGPMLPYRWAMPVYGLMRRASAKITLEPLPPNLNITDMWPVAVREGHFNRSVAVRTRTDGFLTTYLKDYQGATVRAFYGVPDNGGWSTLYGPPFADVIGEEPTVLDDDVIQVRQAPIYIGGEPTQYDTMADPVRPAFTVYTRTTVAGPWVSLPWSGIRDYNRKTGMIYLTTPLRTDDPTLLRVDYTTERRNYYFKQFSGTLLNLNPFVGSKELIGKPIYIYILPEYVQDSTGVVIAASVTTEPLRFTTSPTIFDPLRPDYDPLAIMLGVIYMSTALDISSLAMMDTRRRGGGVKDSASTQEVARLVAESASYWDINNGAGDSYQKAGFVVVRMPSALKNNFTEQDIVDAIERNITAGVRFRIEDLAGNDWSMV